MSDTYPLPVNLEAEPGVAAAVFGEYIETARCFVDDLARHGEPLGLLGPQEYERLWTRHIINSVLLAPLLSGDVADVGSGAGLPGIPLAIARPDVTFTLVEPMERRAEWLDRCRERLGLENVTVVRDRAEALHETLTVDIVTARAVSAFAKLIPLVVPLLRHGGELALLKGKSVEAEIEIAAKQVRRFGLVDVRVELLGADLVEEPTRVLRARAE